MSYLRHEPTGDRYPYNESLAKRPDMVTEEDPFRHPEGAPQEDEVDDLIAGIEFGEPGT
jgi:hypothetical protein